jgi:hypothetical protein
MEKQFLINQFKLDKHLLFLIKDYTFETILDRDKIRRYKERNNSYLYERIDVKTCIFEMGERNEIIEMPNVFYRNIDNEYDKMASHLNECWLAVEEEIVFLWNKHAIQREKTLENKDIMRDNEIEHLLINASIYDAASWKKCRHNILSYVDEFDIELVSFKESYFMCVEGRDIYMPFFLEDGSLTFYRKGVLDEDNDTILHDRHSWWKEIYLSSGEMCSINPSTNAIYKYWSYKKSNIIGALYNNEIVLF